MTGQAELHEDVRRRYAAAASTVIAGAGTASDCSHPGRTCAGEGHATGPAFYAPWMSRACRKTPCSRALAAATRPL